MSKLPAARKRCMACREALPDWSVRWTRLLADSAGDNSPGVREDYCENCWRPQLGSEAASFWKCPVLPRNGTRLSRDEEVRKIESLVQRLEAPEHERDYLLGLLLLQRRLATLSAVDAQAQPVPMWTLRVRGRKQPLCVPDLGQQLSTVRLEA